VAFRFCTISISHLNYHIIIPFSVLIFCEGFKLQNTVRVAYEIAKGGSENVNVFVREPGNIQRQNIVIHDRIF
jgi:hypothetical protein